MELTFPWPTTPGEWYAWTSALATVVFGLLLMFAPRIAFRVLRLTTAEAHPNAIAQARATMSGFYLGLGLCCILFAQPMLYIALGVSWAFTVFGRIISMMSDQGNTPYNWVALVLELALAALPLAYGLGFVP